MSFTVPAMGGTGDFIVSSTKVTEEPVKVNGHAPEKEWSTGFVLHGKTAE